MDQDRAAPGAASTSPGVGSRAPLAPVVPEVLVLSSAVLTTALLVAVAVVATRRRGELESLVEASAVAGDGAVGLINSLVGLAGLSTVAALITTTWWLQGIRDVARWREPRHPPRRSSFWVPMGWIVPVVSWWFPYQVVADASRGVGSRVTSFWPWWVSWLVLINGPVLFGRATSVGGLETAAEVAPFVLAHQVGAAVMVVSCLLWFRIVRSATRGAAAVAKGVRVAS